MKKNVCIVHYNTPVLTEAVIKSIRKHTPDVHITIFDNSDRYPFRKTDDVDVIDNTSGQIIDFVAFLDSYHGKMDSTCNDWGSVKHCVSVDYLFSRFPDGFVLMDSDALLKKDISSLFDESVAYIGEEFVNPKDKIMLVPRLLPFLCWINVKMCKKYGISYFDDRRSWKLRYGGPESWYDTGASFLEDCKKANLPFRNISLKDYIEHFIGASYKGKPWRMWLEENRDLFMEKKKEPKRTEEKILVVIPYCSEGAQGRELEYSVAGWRKHFKEDYLIVLAGEDHPITKTGDDIICVESKRVEKKEGMYRQHLDYVSCFKKVHKKFPESKGFIFVADDCYAVNDFDMSDVMFLKQRSGNMEDYKDNIVGWRQDKLRTKQLLEREGYPTRNFTTHLPQWFEWDKLEALWERFDMENNSYVFEDLYYNIYYPTRIPFQLNLDYDNLKCGVYRPNPRMWYIEEAFKKKIWIQNSVDGWIPALDRMLAEYYGLDK